MLHVKCSSCRTINSFTLPAMGEHADPVCALCGKEVAFIVPCEGQALCTACAENMTAAYELLNRQTNNPMSFEAMIAYFAHYRLGWDPRPRTI